VIKRPKKRRPAVALDEIERRNARSKVFSRPFRDISPLIDLISEIDCTLDPKLLLSLFDPPLTSEELRHILPHLEDLFDRLTFKRTRNDRRPPSYTRTEQQHKLLQALHDVRNRPRGVKQAEAIIKAARDWGISKTALELAVQGKHTSLRHKGRR